MYLIINSFVGIYLANKLDGSALEFIGIGTAFYYLTKGGLQIPIGLVTDKIKTDKDEILFLLLGNILMGLPYFFYPLIRGPISYYVLQVFMGIGAALNLVSWRKLFAKNLDRGKEGFDYAVYDTIMSLAMTIISVVAGYVANINQSYFDLVMISIGLFMVSSGFWVISIYLDKKRKSAKEL